MRHGIAKLSVALTALICITAATATIAQAAEGPRWKLDNKYLTAGETRELTPGTGEITLKSTILGGPLTLMCTKQSYEKASLNGSSAGNASTFKATEDLSGCTVTGNGNKCIVTGGTIKTEPLEGHLAYATKERTGKILVLLGNDRSLSDEMGDCQDARRWLCRQRNGNRRLGCRGSGDGRHWQ